jgi:2-oxoacid:acceptor oxidoreductase delta subunit (pyruvate/2-ketoisovalerate family)
VYRRTRSEMPAILEEIAESEHEGVEFHFQRAPVALSGNGRVTTLVTADVEMGPPDASGRRRPVVTDRTSSMACDHVLLALGQSADQGLLPEGAVIVDGRVHVGGQPTNVHACGDFSTGEGTVSHAIGDGRRTAHRVLNNLGEKVAVFARPDKVQVVPVSSIRPEYFATRLAAAETHEPVATRVHNFHETNHGIPDPREAERCFSCGHCTRCDTCLVFCPEGIIERALATDGTNYLVNLDYCKGCGICVTECPRGAMEMFPQ